jgi:hypothetical protein
MELIRRGDNDCVELFPSHMDFCLLLDVYRHFIGTECADRWWGFRLCLPIGCWQLGQSWRQPILCSSRFIDHVACMSRIATFIVQPEYYDFSWHSGCVGNWPHVNYLTARFAMCSARPILVGRVASCRHRLTTWHHVSWRITKSVRCKKFVLSKASNLRCPWGIRLLRCVGMFHCSFSTLENIFIG